MEKEQTELGLVDTDIPAAMRSEGESRRPSASQFSRSRSIPRFRGSAEYVIELNPFAGFTRDQKKYVLGAFARESNAHETM